MKSPEILHELTFRDVFKSVFIKLCDHCTNQSECHKPPNLVRK